MLPFTSASHQANTSASAHSRLRSIFRVYFAFCLEASSSVRHFTRDVVRTLDLTFSVLPGSDLRLNLLPSVLCWYKEGEQGHETTTTSSLVYGWRGGELTLTLTLMTRLSNFTLFQKQKQEKTLNPNTTSTFWL